MRKFTPKSIVAAILVMVLFFCPLLPVSAQEVTEPAPTASLETTPPETAPAETAPPETVPEETAPVETAPAETEPAETEPPEEESFEIPIGEPDPDSAVYQIIERLSANMGARHLFVYHTGTGQMLYSKTVSNGKLFPASTTKLFTTYVALQYLDPESSVTAGDELDLVHEGSSLAFVSRGMRLRVRTLVEGLMLPSGNDAAMVLAAAAGRVIAGDETLSGTDAVAVFVDEMNLQAEKFGFEKSHFSNPDGWHSGSHYTSMNDMARIGQLALGSDVMRRYMRLGTDEKNFGGEQLILWENSNLLVHPASAYYRTDAIGMKTGYTRPAGYSLMSAFTSEQGDLIIGLFGYTNKNDRFLDAIALSKAVKEQLRLEAASSESVG